MENTIAQKLNISGICYVYGYCDCDKQPYSHKYCTMQVKIHKNIDEINKNIEYYIRKFAKCEYYRGQLYNTELHCCKVYFINDDNMYSMINKLKNSQSKFCVKNLFNEIKCINFQICQKIDYKLKLKMNKYSVIGLDIIRCNIIDNFIERNCPEIIKLENDLSELEKIKYDRNKLLEQYQNKINKFCDPCIRFHKYKLYRRLIHNLLINYKCK